MKRKIFLILPIIMFMMYIPVKAEDYISVCNTECDYRTLNEALTYIENTPSITDIEIGVLTNDEQIISNHNLKARIYIDTENNYLNINGNNSTITLNGPIMLSSEVVSLKNLNINSNITENISTLNAGVLNINSRTANINNVNITNSKKATCNDMVIGLMCQSDNLSITNSNINNFSIGITSLKNIIINNCNLENNYISIAGQYYTSITDSSITRTVSGGLLDIRDSNLVNNLKIKRVSRSSLNDMTNVRGGTTNYNSEIDSMCSLFKDNYIYILDSPQSSAQQSISIQKKLSFNLKNTKNVDILDYFVDKNSADVNNFTYSIDNNEVANIQNGNVVLLRKGTARVTIENTTTNERYIAIINVIQPRKIIPVPTINPETGFKYSIILILFLAAGIAIITYKESNKKDSN